jgi:endonuclease/exonuclease/phosphatase family metal-dependent hydrolase
MRIVVCTLNLWRKTHWPERRRALCSFLERYRPDVLALQELQPETRDTIDATLVEHERVENGYAGWSEEGNLYWNRRIFSCLEYGAEDFGAVEEHSEMYWVRLRANDAEHTEILVATAHFTACNKPDERRTATNPRLAETDRCAEHLNRLAPADQRTIFLGDLNEDEHPLWRFKDAGFQEACSALGRLPEPTSPTMGMPGKIPAVDDWILFRGPVRPMTYEVAHCHSDPLPPADHWPVLATFEL